MKLFKIIAVLTIIGLAGHSSLALAGEKTPAYTYNLEELIEKARENIRKIDREIEQQKIERLVKEKEEQAREIFEEGQALYEEGRLEEARQKWERALEIAESPELKRYIGETRTEEEVRVRGTELAPLKEAEPRIKKKAPPEKEIREKEIEKREKARPGKRIKERPELKEEEIEKERGAELSPLRKRPPEEKIKPEIRKKERIRKPAGIKEPSVEKRTRAKEEEKDIRRGTGLSF
jgi:tetratricopeptide (TPR) repeat protein